MVHLSLNMSLNFSSFHSVIHLHFIRPNCSVIDVLDVLT